MVSLQEPGRREKVHGVKCQRSFWDYTCTSPNGLDQRRSCDPNQVVGVAPEIPRLLAISAEELERKPVCAAECTTALLAMRFHSEPQGHSKRHCLPVAVVTEMMDSWSFCLQGCLPGASVHADCRMPSLKNTPALPLPCLPPCMCASCLQVEFQVRGGAGGPWGLASTKSQDIPSPASFPRLYIPGLMDFFLSLMLF